MTNPSHNLPPILPAGTAVVSRVDIRGRDGRVAHPRGAAGLITASPVDPLHSYRVRFPGGDEASLTRRELHVLSHYHAAAFTDADLDRDPVAEYDLTDHVIYRCVVGSRAYGLDRDGSDTDRRGVYLPPADMHWSIWGVPEQLERDATQEVYWELGKYVRLALKANPNVLETLYTPIVEHATPIAAELRDMRGAFLSKLVYQTYNGYAMSQFRKMEQDLRNKGAVKHKHAMHLLRLLLSGITALREGHVPVRVDDEHREQLIAVRDGAMPWDEVERWRMALHAEFEREFIASRLPERPDYNAANALVVRARRSVV